jgi:RNA polymerase sigma-70 factor, ECF subfamily
MQHGAPPQRSHRGISPFDAVRSAFAVLLGTATLRVAAAGGVRLGLPVHLAAVADYTVTRQPSEGEPAEVIDPEVVKLVREAQDGNAHAFSLLYDRYIDKVYRYCVHRVGDAETAEDLTADVFMRALRRIGSFSWQGKDFGAWLVTIARNRCHDHFKSAKFRMEHAVAEVYDSAPAPSYDADHSRGLELADLRAEVHAALAKLKSDQAEVLYHRFLEGRDVEQTAQIMGRNEGAIRALQYRALKALAKHVDLEALR